MLLTVLLVCLSSLATSVLYWLCPALSLWWRLPVWLGCYVAIALVYILAVVAAFLLLPQRDPSPRTQHVTHRFIEWTLAWVLLMLGYTVTVEGKERLPRRPYLLVGNHRSAFDPLCTAAALTDENVVFVAKPGVFKIPVIGSILRRLCFLPIDRENARNAVTTIKQAAHLIADIGLSVGIYPEGTRSKTGELLPFHAGSFKIASLAACPVAVVTVRYEKRPLWGKRVRLHVADVMDADYVAANNTAAMADRARDAIAADLEA